MVAFILGLLIGVAFGFVVCAVLSASRQEEEILDQIQKEEIEEIEETADND